MSKVSEDEASLISRWNRYNAPRSSSYVTSNTVISSNSSSESNWILSLAVVCVVIAIIPVYILIIFILSLTRQIMRTVRRRSSIQPEIPETPNRQVPGHVDSVLTTTTHSPVITKMLGKEFIPEATWSTSTRQTQPMLSDNKPQELNSSDSKGAPPVVSTGLKSQVKLLDDSSRSNITTMSTEQENKCQIYNKLLANQKKLQNLMQNIDRFKAKREAFWDKTSCVLADLAVDSAAQLNCTSSQQPIPCNILEPSSSAQWLAVGVHRKIKASPSRSRSKSKGSSSVKSRADAASNN